MPRRSFYQVPRNAWLYVDAHETRPLPEESVRQWCLQELIRAYGVSIVDIRSEARAKVGSKNYRIDLLVESEGRPLIVVECKRREHSNHSKAMEQAISYANSQRIQAEFSVYTNGDVWQVQRRMPTGWVPVPDLPIIGGRSATQDLTDHLRVLRSIQPMLYMLDQPVKGSEAARLLLAMQCYFNGTHTWCYEQDQVLRDAADNILRVIANPSNHPNYRFGKLFHATKCLSDYAERHGFRLSPTVVEKNAMVSQELRFAGAQWQEIAKNSKALQAADIPLINLISALFDYGQSLPSSTRKYPPVSNALHIRLREYLDSTLTAHFGIRLPDVSDKFSTSDLRGHSSDAWKHFDKYHNSF